MKIWCIQFTIYKIYKKEPDSNRFAVFLSGHSFSRGTQRIVSVNYLFGRPSYNFLKGIFTSNFRGMGNLRPSVFGFIKMSFRVPKKDQLRFSERK